MYLAVMIFAKILKILRYWKIFAKSCFDVLLTVWEGGGALRSGFKMADGRKFRDTDSRSERDSPRRGSLGQCSTAHTP